ncbi:hypothetical protein D3C86_25030 [compost metagenome]
MSNLRSGMKKVIYPLLSLFTELAKKNTSDEDFFLAYATLECWNICVQQYIVSIRRLPLLKSTYHYLFKIFVINSNPISISCSIATKAVASSVSIVGLVSKSLVIWANLISPAVDEVPRNL